MLCRVSLLPEEPKPMVTQLPPQQHHGEAGRRWWDAARCSGQVQLVFTLVKMSERELKVNHGLWNQSVRAQESKEIIQEVNSHKVGWKHVQFPSRLVISVISISAVGRELQLCLPILWLQSLLSAHGALVPLLYIDVLCLCVGSAHYF